MRIFIALVSVIIFSCSSKNEKIFGSWKLYEIKDKDGITKLDKDMNELIRQGIIKRVMTFFSDSTCEDILYQNDRLEERILTKYSISVDKNTLTLLSNDEQKTDWKILTLTSDTLRMLRSSHLITVFIRERSYKLK